MFLPAMSGSDSAACTGLASALGNINPERISLGSSRCTARRPDIAGRNIANPIGQIWSGAMMLEHLGHQDAGEGIVRAIERVLAEGPRTRDIGGKASTSDVGKAIAAAL